MHPKTLFYWFYNHARDYNLFIANEDALDDNDNEPQDQVTIVKHQKYSTWLYILLLIGT